MDRRLEIFARGPIDYVKQMRSQLVGMVDLEQLAVDRALAEGGG